MFIPHLSTYISGLTICRNLLWALTMTYIIGYNWPCDTVRQAPESQPQTRAHTDFDGADKVQKHYSRKEMSKCQHCYTHTTTVFRAEENVHAIPATAHRFFMTNTC